MQTRPSNIHPGLFALTAVVALLCAPVCWQTGFSLIFLFLVSCSIGSLHQRQLPLEVPSRELGPYEVGAACEIVADERDAVYTRLTAAIG